MNKRLEIIADNHHAAVAAETSAVGLYAEASELTGGFVQIQPEYNCLPLLIGTDGQPVLVYQFVEALDQYVDYKQLQAEFPTLTYGQIAGAIAFLRKLAQFNNQGKDIDDLEEELIEATPEFQAAIERSLAEQETERVLTVE